jgi:hypothetical protein
LRDQGFIMMHKVNIELMSLLVLRCNT